MKKYSSSDIKTFSVYCPKALKFQEDGAPRDTSQMAYGVASHAILEAIGKRTNQGSWEDNAFKLKHKIANAVCKELITNGRSFRGHKEPPMSPEHAFEGKRVALGWLEFNELPNDADYEIQLESGRLIALHDCVWIEDWSNEYSEKQIAVSRDWKGWQGSEAELDTWQRKTQAITLAAHYQDADELRLEVVSLQTHRTYTREIVLDDDGLALLEQWRQELEIICGAMDKTREARPGAGCLECPYASQCQPAKHWFPDKEDRTAEYLVSLELERKETLKILKAHDNLPVTVNGGYVGWRLWGDNKAKPNARIDVMDAWFDTQELLRESWDDKLITPNQVSSLLKALQLGTANINALAKTIWGKKPENEAMRDDFLDACIEQRNGKRFGVWKGEPKQ